MTKRQGASPEDVGAALAQQAAAPAAITAKAPDEFSAFVERYRSQIVDSLPSTYGNSPAESYTRFVRVLTTEVRRNPGLLQPSRRASLLAAMVLSAQLGLEPGPSQRVYFIPYRDEVQFQLGWRGMQELAMRSGLLAQATTLVVRHGDQFDYRWEDFDLRMLYRPLPGNEDAATTFVAFAKYTNGERDIEVMTRAQVDAIMRRSQSAKPKHMEATEHFPERWQATSGPWATDYDEMGRKTVLKRLLKRVPMSEQDKRALEADEVVVKSIEPDMLQVPDATVITTDQWSTVPPEDAIVVEADAPDMPADTELPLSEQPELSWEGDKPGGQV